jgi:hypothetical protein
MASSPNGPILVGIGAAAAVGALAITAIMRTPKKSLTAEIPTPSTNKKLFEAIDDEIDYNYAPRDNMDILSQAQKQNDQIMEQLPLDTDDLLLTKYMHIMNTMKQEPTMDSFLKYKASIGDVQINVVPKVVPASFKTDLLSAEDKTGILQIKNAKTIGLCLHDFSRSEHPFNKEELKKALVTAHQNAVNFQPNTTMTTITSSLAWTLVTGDPISHADCCSLVKACYPPMVLRHDKDPFMQILALFVSLEVYMAADCLQFFRLILIGCKDVNIKGGYGLKSTDVALAFIYVYNSLLADTKCNLIVQDPSSPSISLLHNLEVEYTMQKLTTHFFISTKSSIDAERVAKLEEQGHEFRDVLALHKAEMKRLEGGKSKDKTPKDNQPKIEKKGKTVSNKGNNWVCLAHLNGTCGNSCGHSHNFPDWMKQAQKDELQDRAYALLDVSSNVPTRNPRTQPVSRSDSQAPSRRPSRPSTRGNSPSRSLSPTTSTVAPASNSTNL